MPVALTSGRRWEPDPEENFVTSENGVTTKALVRDADEPSYAAIAKWANTSVGTYSLGIERVAYTLGDQLGLPIPEVYLEDFGGNASAIVRRIPNHAEYLRAKNIPQFWSSITNRDIWPLGVAFDIWMANYDRRSANFAFGPIPETTRPAVARRAKCWLVDHGLCGLWYPGKIDAGLAAGRSLDVDRIADATAPLTSAAVARFRDVMQTEVVEYRRAFTDLGAPERDAILDRIRNLTDDQVAAAVQEVPRSYFSARAAELTIAFLSNRKDNIGTVSRDIWPV